jgi:iron-sulfur cluster assembly accessory protein
MATPQTTPTDAPTPDATPVTDAPVDSVEAARATISADQPVAMTPKAVRMVQLTREEEGLDDTAGLRIAVRGGGCSGFEYALDFETESRDTDLVYQQGEMTLFVDPLSARYLEGTVIDYVMGAQGAGFKFENPKAVGTCGCGSSFAV